MEFFEHIVTVYQLPNLLAEAGFADVAPTIVGVIGGFGDVWKSRNDNETAAYVAAHRTHLPALLLFELAHEGRAIPQMEQAAELAGLSLDFNRWVARLSHCDAT